MKFIFCFSESNIDNLQHLTKQRAHLPKRRPPTYLRQYSNDSDIVCQSNVSDRSCDIRNIAEDSSAYSDKSSIIYSRAVNEQSYLNFDPQGQTLHLEESKKVQRRSLDNSALQPNTVGNILHRKADHQMKEFHPMAPQLTKPLSLPYASSGTQGLAERHIAKVSQAELSPKLRSKLSRSQLVDHVKPHVQNRGGTPRHGRTLKEADDTSHVDDTIPNRNSPPKYLSPPHHLTVAQQHSQYKERNSSYGNANITAFESDSDSEGEIMV